MPASAASAVGRGESSGARRRCTTFLSSPRKRGPNGIVRAFAHTRVAGEMGPRICGEDKLVRRMNETNIPPGCDTVAKLFRHTAAARGEHVAMMHKDFGIWQKVTWREYGERARWTG